MCNAGAGPRWRTAIGVQSSRRSITLDERLYNSLFHKLLRKLAESCAWASKPGRGAHRVGGRSGVRNAGPVHAREPGPGLLSTSVLAGLIVVCGLGTHALGQWASFDEHREAQVPTRRAPSGQLLVRPTLDGVDLGWFVLDTGASVNVITPRARARLNPRRAGSTRSEDIAGHEVTTARWVVDELSLGPMTIHGAALTEIELDNLTQRWGVSVAGLLGRDTFVRAVFELDIARGRVAIHDPRRYTLTAQPDSQPGDTPGDTADEPVAWDRLDLRGGVPHVPASFEGRAGRFFLDTGDGASVTFHAPAVGRYRLLRDRVTNSRTVHALRGSIEYHYGAIERFELGGHAFTQLGVAFTPRRAGVYLERYDTGRIGCGVLGPFRIVLDYPNRRYALIERPLDGDAQPMTQGAHASPALDAYAGSYELADGTLRRVWHKDGRLLTQRPGGPVLIARVQADDRFVYDSLGIHGRFERNDTGEIVAMVVAFPGEPPERSLRASPTDPR